MNNDWRIYQIIDWERIVDHKKVVAFQKEARELSKFHLGWDQVVMPNQRTYRTTSTYSKHPMLHIATEKIKKEWIGIEPFQSVE